MAFASSPAETRAPDRAGRRLWLAFALVSVLATVAAFVVAADLGRSHAIASVRAAGDSASTLAIAVLRGELEKQRALPLILVRDPDVEAALDGADTHELDAKLEDIARETRTAVIYLLDRSGRAIAASNWREPTSFIGTDYAFRDYYREAMARGSAEQFALGTVSNRPGLYITRRVDGPEGEPGGALGVIVVKVEFDRVEDDWRALGGQTLVTDRRGVVLLSTVPAWRFHVEEPLAPAAAAEMRRTLQFGDAPLQPLPFTRDGDMVTSSGAAAGRYLVTRTGVPTTDWQLDLLLPVERAIRSERGDLQAIAALALMPAIALAGFLLRRRRQAAAQRRADARIKAELERRVEERTAALAGANARLIEEIAERGRAQERLSDAREELGKANRLATLGQVTAGVAHEINQPLAAIRTYAENARALLKRRDEGATDLALDKVVSLTERIGLITETLRGFARRGDGALEPVSVADAVAGALMILDAPLRQAGLTLAVEPVPPGLKVMARRVELEQVLVNLMRNAIEALGTAPPATEGPPLSLCIDAGADSVTLTVADRGPGMTAAEVAALFTPFRSSKPKGLGLGLVICHDIVGRFGGTLSPACRPGEGCAFTIVLKRAP
ncbi:two-component system C4-dicarboxylate transport sensor histidine kinase DctB [Angulomicrobium tetraedrale]|uniref:histidine kinase n=1 Tax=Ancylobacter tetraedralis TaxID=217068 RepID=A0A839Z7M7_9HYPH|nr:ATP-binding protein [Ancylobacter tetraedralis]MBB3770496.1 two-component system C4-dicarboxylate transport sensor histidine kinase DctB [Ancylobacter tetraedralis]